MSTYDKNKSFQDGFNGQGYNGRNWDQWSSGTLIRAEEDKRRAEANKRYFDSQNSTTAGGNNANAGEQPYAKDDDGLGLITLLLLPVALAGIGILALAGILAVFTTPVLKLAEKLFGSDERKNYGGVYVTSFLSLSAYGLTAAVAAGVIYLLGRYVVLHGVLGVLSLEIYTAVHALLNNGDMGGVPVASALLAIQVPALAGMAFMLRRQYGTLFSGLAGFLRGIATGVVMLAATALVLILFAGVMANIS